jgi:hypothetical protein
VKLRLVFVYLWLVVPVLALVLHYSWGKTYLKEDQMWGSIERAVDLEASAKQMMTVEGWESAEVAYAEVIDTFEETDSGEVVARVMLARARCMLYKGKLVSAMLDLEAQLGGAIRNDVSAAVQRDIRETLARSQFGIAWIMRHEGASYENWTKIADRARQNFRYLAELAPNEEERRKSAQNLEIAVWLERLDSSHPWEELMKKRRSEAGEAEAGSVNVEGQKQAENWPHIKPKLGQALGIPAGNKDA